jgi:hypothetical protein
MVTVGLLFVLLAGPPQVLARDALSSARIAYNDRRFDEAIAAATEAEKLPELADTAAVVLARSYLERYHAGDPDHRDPADLDRARTALKSVDASKLTARDRVEYLVGLGESLFFEEPPRYAAAAEMFAAALGHADDATADARESMFEWWAESLDREAQFVPERERKLLYERILTRAEGELAHTPESAVAAYWLAAAARGSDDLERAWGAAIAGWIRAGSLGTRGVTLRADLDRLMTNVILPERARQLTPSGDAQSTLALLRQQWDDLKKKWERLPASGS